jgi:predicted transcriptional regulator YheO
MTGLINSNIVELLKRLAEGIVAVVGPNCEVVVHDFSDLEHSVIWVSGNLTGRKPGAPVPDIDFISEHLESNASDQLNYVTTIGSRKFQSTTVWVRNEQNSIVGAICINVDYSNLLQARDLLEKLTNPVNNFSSFTVTNTFAKDIDELVNQSIIEFISMKGYPDIRKMNRENKVDLIRYLENKGLFQIRGAVDKVSSLLEVSRGSIYNYRSDNKGSKN